MIIKILRLFHRFMIIEM